MQALILLFASNKFAKQAVLFEVNSSIRIENKFFTNFNYYQR